MLADVVYILVGFVLLIKGADILVKGATSIAQKAGVSYFVIGLTIVAFGTSMPELVVNLIASMKGTTDIAVGNILGSNMANILLIVGLTALFMPLDVNIYARKRDIPYAFLAALVLLVLAVEPFGRLSGIGALTRVEGLLLLGGFLYFLSFVLRSSRDAILDEEVYDEAMSPLRAGVYVTAGLVGLYLGGDVIVEHATGIARSFGVSDILISSTIVAFGTSLPELATSLLAVYKKNSDIAVGNIVGSNIFNILWILGISALITPIPFPDSLFVDMAAVVLASLLLLGIVRVKKEYIIGRSGGIILFVSYFAYLLMLFLRG